MADLLPASAVVPTRHRPAALRRTLESLAQQDAQPADVVIIDASESDDTLLRCSTPPAGLRSAVRWVRATSRGAASQRNEGVRLAGGDFVLFFDDDVIFEPHCLRRLWDALHSDPKLGGVNATVSNQGYSPPGRVSRLVFPLLAGRRLPCYAGRVIGPGVNFLPRDGADLPDVVPVDWLNTTCALYRRAALPDPPFPPWLTGYSLMEDLTLSLTVGKSWRLANARTARIYHDSQPGDHKSRRAELAAMELTNRHRVMARVLGRRGAADHLRLLLWELYGVAAAARLGPAALAAELAGKARGGAQLMGAVPNAPGSRR